MATAGTVHVGIVEVVCPVCDEHMPATVTAEIVPGDDGQVSLDCRPDMTDIWAHMWAHN